MMTGKRREPWPRFVRSLWAAFGFMIAGADYASKKYMIEWLAERGGKVTLTPFLDLTSIYNTGVAFGLFADTGDIGRQILTAFPFVFCMGIYGYLMLYRNIDLVKAFIAALLLGGGVGNAAERMLNGKVFDFIDFHIGDLHWPAFNLADMSISLAMMLMVWLAFKPQPKADELSPQ